jgi:hypothetical protein
MASPNIGVCVETPAHESFTSVCSGGFITSPPEPIEEATVAEASNIDALIYQLTENADNAAAAALEKINALAALSPPALPGINYEAPSWDTPAIYGPTVPPLELTDAPVPSNNVSWGEPVLNNVDQPADTIAEPSTTLPEVPESPPLTGAPGEVPPAPAEYDPGTLTAPTLVTPDLTLGTVNDPVLEEITITIPGELEIDALSYTIDYTAIDEAIARAESIVVPDTEIPDYVQLIPEVFTVVGSMVSGVDPVNGDLVLGDDVQARKVAPMLDRRNLDVPAHVHTFDDWLQGVMQEHSADSATLFSAQHRDDVIKAAFSLAAKAEEILVQIDLGLYDARFKYALERAKAQLVLAKAIVAGYNAEVAKLDALVLNYNSQLIALRAQAQAVLTEAEIANLIGGANKLIARQFTIGEEAKQSDVRVFRAQISGEAAKLTAQKAKVEALEAAVAQAQAGMLTYTGDTAAYEGEVQNVRNIFDSYVAKSRAVTEENEMSRAEERASTAGLKGLAAQARSAASAAAAEAVRKARISKSNEAYYLSGGAVNDVARYEIASTKSDYSQEVTQMSVDAAVDSVEASSIASIGQAISRFTRIALESSGRAASLAQRANESLARAYAAAYEAAGKAGAAVAAGQMSGFRASASMTAAGSIDASRTSAESYSSSGNIRYSESDTASQTISV